MSPCIIVDVQAMTFLKRTLSFISSALTMEDVGTFTPYWKQHKADPKIPYVLDQCF